MSPNLNASIARGTDPQRPIRRALHRARAWVEKHPHLRWVYRAGVALLGLVIVVVGIILIPLPGPGWLIVFVGLATLGTEFPAAHRLAAALKRILTRGLAWWRQRRPHDSGRQPSSRAHPGTPSKSRVRTPIHACTAHRRHIGPVINRGRF